MGGTETNQGLKKKGAAIIHTMPKSFLSSTAPGKNNTKRVGLFILVGGGVLLLVIFVAAYYYLTILGDAGHLQNPSMIEIYDYWKWGWTWGFSFFGG